MKLFIDQALEAANSFSVPAVLEVRGKKIEFDQGPEHPIVIEPRELSLANVRTLVRDCELEPWINLVSTGIIPTGLVPTRQLMEVRTRSLKLADPSYQYIVQGFGAGIDSSNLLFGDMYVFRPPMPEVSLTDFDTANNMPSQMGTFYYTKEGEEDPRVNTSKLGCIWESALNQKIANTAKAQRILNGAAIVPEWIVQGNYTQINDLESGEAMAWGVYRLPHAIFPGHLAEISRSIYADSENDPLFEQYIYMTFRALRKLHASNYVHLQPHKGNLAAMVSGGSIRPVISDWSTMTNISNFPNNRAAKSNVELTPKQLILTHDCVYCLRTLLDSYFGMGYEGKYMEPRMSLLNLEPQVNRDPKRLLSLINAAVCGYISPMGQDGENLDIEDMAGGLEIYFQGYADDEYFRKTGEYGAAVSRFMELIITGVYPHHKFQPENKEVVAHMRQLMDMKIQLSKLQQERRIQVRNKARGYRR
jgi:hypothetical protein